MMIVIPPAKPDLVRRVVWRENIRTEITPAAKFLFWFTCHTIRKYMNQRIVQRVYWRILRLAGFKRLSWDKQAEAGIWCRGAVSQHTIERVAELCGSGRVVEFGCGDGRLPLSLSAYLFEDYVGYDISELAIQRARESADASGLTNCSFEQCDMAEWQGVSSASLIIAEECLYYLTPPDMEAFLQRCCDSLSPGGSILVIVHSAIKHARTLETCRRVCKVKNEQVVNGRTYLTLAPNRDDHRG